ncbi:helix-turn-helix transcriptional regulator [Citrobacter werkmanii]
MKDITAHSGLSDKHYYSLIARGLFPRPLKIGRSSRWRKSDYEAWLNERDTNRK